MPSTPELGAALCEEVGLGFLASAYLRVETAGRDETGCGLMGYRLLTADSAFWRRSNQMGVLNTDLGKQLETSTLGARLWRLEPGQASTKHRHSNQEELYVLLEGTGRIRVDDQDPLKLEHLDALVVEPRSVRQVFNDSSEDALWLVVGAPPELANTLEMTAKQLRDLYPDGPKALPPELADD